MRAGYRVQIWGGSMIFSSRSRFDGHVDDDDDGDEEKAEGNNNMNNKY